MSGEHRNGCESADWIQLAESGSESSVSSKRRGIS